MTTNTKAMLLALSPFLSLFIGGFFFIPPLILWAVWKDEDPEIDALGKRVINAQISWFLWVVVATILLFFIIGVILLPLVMILWFIYTLVRALACNNGDLSYKFPLTIKFLS